MRRFILIVEDDENDRLFEQLAFADVGLAESLRFVTDGQQAIDYLEGNAEYVHRVKFPLPHLILLDLNLPVLPGLDVLRWIRRRPRFKSTIVIPLTSSNSPIDIQATQAAGANDYLIKPPSIRGWRGIARRIQRTWLHPRATTSHHWGSLNKALASA